MCEEGGNWNVDGPLFSGGLGFTHANWNQFNTFGFPSDAAYATPEQQVRVAVAFASYYWGNPTRLPTRTAAAEDTERLTVPHRRKRRCGTV